MVEQLEFRLLKMSPKQRELERHLKNKEHCPHSNFISAAHNEKWFCDYEKYCPHQEPMCDYVDIFRCNYEHNDRWKK